MQFKKYVPYKLKRALPILGLAGASMFAACDKQEKEIPVPLHDTVYEWGMHNMANMLPSGPIKASADSASVRYVIIKCSGDWGYAFSTKNVREHWIEPLFARPRPENVHKIKGAGYMYRLVLTTANEADDEHAQFLKDFGFELIDAEYDPEFRDPFNGYKPIGAPLYNQKQR